MLLKQSLDSKMSSCIDPAATAVTDTGTASFSSVCPSSNQETQA